MSLLRDISFLLTKIKETVLAAIEAQKPVNYVYGEVTSISPLIISVDQKLVLTSAQVILTRNVTNHEVKLRVSNVTQTYTVLNSLSVGDKLLLSRVQGGQQYIVLDKVVE